MLVGIEGESEGYRASIVLSGVLTVYLRVYRFIASLPTVPQLLYHLSLCIVSAFRNLPVGCALKRRRTSCA
ncbi:MAG: hypothetical protein ACYDER_19650 [Ktedonobacteraceae bacterium]